MHGQNLTFFSTTYQKPCLIVLRKKYESLMISIYLFLFFATSCHLAGQQFLLVSGVSGELKYDLF